MILRPLTADEDYARETRREHAAEDRDIDQERSDDARERWQFEGGITADDLS